MARRRVGWFARSWILLFCLVGMLTACGTETEPTPTAVPQAVPLLPTLAPTATSASVATATPLAAAESPLDASLTGTMSITLDSPLTVTVAATSTLTLTDPSLPAITDVVTSAFVSGTVDSAVVPDLPPAECPVEPDIALATYPDLYQHLGCAQDEASFEPVALNEFGTGPDYERFMLWFSSENQIYVLLPSGQWERYLDTWTEEQETFLCNPLDGEATSPPLPRRGFGKIWCTVEGLQETMGMVEREERLCQHTVTQRFTRGRLIACYEDATIRFFRIMDDGTWAQMLTM